MEDFIKYTNYPACCKYMMFDPMFIIILLPNIMYFCVNDVILPQSDVFQIPVLIVKVFKEYENAL